MPEFVCIACPIDCMLTVTVGADGEILVAGNRCPKGDVFAREEMLAPKRVVTAVVRTDSPRFPFIPVRTDKPLPRELIPGLMADLSRLEVRLPARLGTVLMENYQGSGVGVILTRTLPPIEIPKVP